MSYGDHSEVRTLSSPPPYHAYPNGTSGYEKSGAGSPPGQKWVSKLGRALGGGSDTGSVTNNQPIASTGRGGAGNFVRSESTSRARAEGIERGRELYEHHDDNQVYSTGRGGQGNLRSPSRDPEERLAIQKEEEILRKHREETAGNYVSTGRGGTGNLSPVRGQDGSRSRSRPREPVIHGVSSGRGGIGNIVEEQPSNLATLDEEERKKHHHHFSLFGHGRGGQGNISSQTDNVPHPTEVPNYEAAATHSSGRGGAGNIY